MPRDQHFRAQGIATQDERFAIGPSAATPQPKNQNPFSPQISRIKPDKGSDCIRAHRCDLWSNSERRYEEILAAK